MKWTKQLFLLFFVFSFSISNALNTPDSLYNALKQYRQDTQIIYTNLELAYYYRDINPDSAFKYSYRGFHGSKEKKYVLGLLKSSLSLGALKTTYNETDSALYYSFLGLKYCKEYGNIRYMVNAYIHIADAYNTQYQIDTAIKYYKKANDIIKNDSVSMLKASILNNLGIAYHNKLDYKKALSYYYETLNIFSKLRKETLAAITLNNIGRINTELEKFDKAISNFQSAIQTNKKTNNLFHLCMNYFNLGIVFGRKAQFDSALYYYDLAEEIADNNGFIMTKARIYHNYGQEYNDMGRYSEAKIYLNKSINLCIKNNVQEGLIHNYISLAETFGGLKLYDSSIFYLNSALKINKELNIVEVQGSIYEGLSDNYYKIKDYKKAYEYYRIADSIADSTLSLSVQNQLNELQTKYETEKNRKEIASLKLKDELNSNKILRQNLTIFIILGVLIILTLLIVSLIASRKRKEELIVKLEEKNREISTQSEELKDLNATKDKFFSIIAHDLKNPFNTLIGFSDLLVKDYEKYNSEEVKSYLEIINKNSKSTYKLLENLLTWSRSQQGDIEFKPEHFDIEKTTDDVIKLLDDSAKEKGISLVKDFIQIKTVFADEKMISTVVLNLMNNAIKFTSQGGKIIIQSKEDSEGKLQINIIDNGVGISAENIQKLFRVDQGFSTKGTNKEEGTGLGLIIVKEFIDKHNSTIKIESEPGKGSRFSFTLDVKA
jgi:signal transduction histidine kinase